MKPPGIRVDLLAELMTCDAERTPRWPALAKLLLTPVLKNHLGLDPKQTDLLTALEKSAADPPPLRPLFTTMDVRIAVGVGVLGE